MEMPILPGAIDPEAVTAFTRVLDELWPREDRDGPLGLAVSGGPDSLALLLVAHLALPGEIASMSIDHGLRAQAQGEVALVERVCGELGVPFASAALRPARGNLQAKAREARYRALARWAEETGLGAVATAHHADDQAETLLMRLARGSGIAGLAGVRAATWLPETEIPLVRPLLGFRKAELESIVAQSGLDPVRDPSNTNRAFDRVRVREHLAQHNWLDVEALAASAGHLAEGWRALEWYAELDWEEAVVLEQEGAPEGPVYRYFVNVPRVTQIETICRIVAALGGQVTRGEAGRAADRLWRGENASLGGVLGVASVETVAVVG
ncbi:MAG: tRNA lysidine(34) synthetase TilS, partial [Erythrobacter sp.]